ncbi:hypothetical protein COV18_05345 [Candidatus Woesearchaeota archaeon CG10_big_fil_rev_8_21_14_0_10_37_12]|nr:MAG: hypothetical protein COV18_05345 [Candidatus Woesearchaeota archaeon CG10_big_fil_rev_8_21_14_0_10_37_12]
MAKEITKKAKVVIVKKKWYPIQAPKLFNEQLVGETYAAAPEDSIGKKVTVSMMNLTGEPQKQNTNVTFKIISVKDNILHTEFIGWNIIPSALKRLVRRNREKIDDSFIVQSADKQYVRIKPLAITRGKTTGSILTIMRKLQRAYLAHMISQAQTENFLKEVLQKKVQQTISQVLRKIHPVFDVQIRQIELLLPEKVKELRLNVVAPPTNLPELNLTQSKPTRKKMRETAAETQEESIQEEQAEETQAEETISQEDQTENTIKA